MPSSRGSQEAGVSIGTENKCPERLPEGGAFQPTQKGFLHEPEASAGEEDRVALQAEEQHWKGVRVRSWPQEICSEWASSGLGGSLL